MESYKSKVERLNDKTDDGEGLGRAIGPLTLDFLPGLAVRVVRFHWSDVVHQLKIELFDQFIECARSHIGANFCHDEVDGGGGVLAILRDG